MSLPLPTAAMASLKNAGSSTADVPRIGGRIPFSEFRISSLRFGLPLGEILKAAPAPRGVAKRYCRVAKSYYPHRDGLYDYSVLGNFMPR
ncbi:hypothetical protein Rcae01_03660 [Novipirellula caenicola]|uniref:Uncharacterized protein n=1 Tax=Novipirellula caenicola TaxID=1536901 RepID=A0ABP9VSR0_9BACT